jgi:hypothetical protein
MINSYSFGTLSLLKKVAEDVDSFQLPGAKPLPVYVIHVDFYEIKDAKERAALNAIPTSFTLQPAQVDRVIATGARMLRESETYNALVRELRSSQ